MEGFTNISSLESDYTVYLILHTYSKLHEVNNTGDIDLAILRYNPAQ